MLSLNKQQQSRVLNLYEKSRHCSTCYRASIDISDIRHVKVKIHALRCRSPFCVRCLKIMRASLYHSLMKFAKSRQLRVMNLNYLNDSTQTPEMILKRYSRDWNCFVLKLRRLGYRFNYFKTIEFTQKDGLHYHVLIDSYVPQHVISTTWLAITGNSYVVWISKTWGKSVAINYVLKYVTKSFNKEQELFAAFRIRRFSFSKYTYDFVKEKSLIESTNFKFDFDRIFFGIDELKNYYRAWYRSATSLFGGTLEIEFIE